jgi:hypothetical protein
MSASSSDTRLSTWDTAALLSFLALCGVVGYARARITRGGPDAVDSVFPMLVFIEALLGGVLAAMFLLSVLAAVVFSCRLTLPLPNWMFPLRGRWLKCFLIGLAALPLVGLLLNGGAPVVMGLLLLWLVLMLPMFVIGMIIEAARGQLIDSRIE